MRFFCSLCLLCLLFACSVDIPSDVIGQRRMEQILYDYHQAQGMAEASMGDILEERYRMAQLVFEKYGITEAEFDSSMVWYSAHSQHLAEMYDHIEARMNNEANLLGGETKLTINYDRYAENQDTTLIWRRVMTAVTADRGKNILSFGLSADSTFQRGDAFELGFTSRFVSQQYQHEGYLLLSARYDNDSVLATSSRIAGDYEGKLVIPVSALSREHDLKSITISLYVTPSNNQFLLWLLSNTYLLRIRTPEEIKDTVASDSVGVADSLKTTDTLRVDTAVKHPAVKPSLDHIRPVPQKGNKPAAPLPLLEKPKRAIQPLRRRLPQH
ncbi:MAG: DUF4296 domain-containing protein [Bacteroidaceae bacterium]|nr:DUF4296 domain-containing protein [Bacteroidaceae bacterium]